MTISSDPGKCFQSFAVREVEIEKNQVHAALAQAIQADGQGTGLVQGKRGFSAGREPPLDQFGVVRTVFNEQNCQGLSLHRVSALSE